MGRRTYEVDLLINGRHLESVVIDPHYEEKHKESVTDEVILALVKQLNGRSFRPIETDDEGYQYFVNAYRR